MSKWIAPASLIIASTLLAVSTPVVAASSAHLSWGKIGVSFEQYRADAVACGRAGYYLDLAQTEQAKVFKRATSRLETNEAGVQELPPLQQTIVVLTSASIVAGTRPDAKFRELRAIQEGPMTTCLRERGYTQFELTEPQKAALRRLRHGSPERHRYLHRLASDPNVLEGQRTREPWVVVEATDSAQDDHQQK